MQNEICVLHLLASKLVSYVHTFIRRRGGGICTQQKTRGDMFFIGNQIPQGLAEGD